MRAKVGALVREVRDGWATDEGRMFILFVAGMILYMLV